jgi:hypothetical protein
MRNTGETKNGAAVKKATIRTNATTWWCGTVAVAAGSWASA